MEYFYKFHVFSQSGECADEIFGGYPWFRKDELINANTFPWSRNIELRASVINPELGKLINAEEYVQERYNNTLADVPKFDADSPLESRMHEIFYLNLNWFMTTLLTRKDRMSMATGLEVRVPFCDHRIMQYVWNIPWEMKFHNKIEKGLVREALKGILPDDVLYRRKSPYPRTHNPSYITAVKSKLREILDDPNMPVHTLINTEFIKNLLNSNDYPSGNPWFGQLMGIPQFFAYVIQINYWLMSYGVRISA